MSIATATKTTAEVQAQQRKVRKMTRAEILETEKTFVNWMQVFLTVYKPILIDSSFGIEQVGQALAQSIEAFLPLHLALVASLERCRSTTSFANALSSTLSNEKLLEAHTAFASAHHAYTCKLAFLREKQDPRRVALAQALNNASMDSNMHDVDSLLIMPPQRVCRYPLLCSDLSKRTSEEHRSRPAVTQALAVALAFASGINRALAQANSADNKNGSRRQRIVEGLRCAPRYLHVNGLRSRLGAVTRLVGR